MNTPGKEAAEWELTRRRMEASDHALFVQYLKNRPWWKRFWLWLTTPD